MQTRLTDQYRNTSEGVVAEAILRKCVHCGFCNATCPTYQLLGDENDGPRGRIYLIKQLLEGQEVSSNTLTHLDRCLTCRSCETTCPSGVEYSKLLDIGKRIAEQQLPRSKKDKATRERLNEYLPNKKAFGTALKLGQTFKRFLPKTLADKVVDTRPAGQWPAARHARRMLILEGCVQPSLSPDINAATARVLDRLGISLIVPSGVGCCGAVNQHLAEPEKAREQMRRNIDAWWPYLAEKVEAIIITASGCGATIKDYAYHLRDDYDYVIKAERIAYLARDISEVLQKEDLSRFTTKPKKIKKVAFQSPCSLQHGQKLNGVVEGILQQCGYELTLVVDAHLCCGSAGTYSILQPEMAEQLRTNKLEHLNAGKPEAIVTANIGCQTHLQGASTIPVYHWVHLLDQLG
jgi:glycolate oxidase iron-sulfur subunit